MYFKQCIIKNIIIYDVKSFIFYFFSILFNLFNLFYLIIFLKIPIRNHLQHPYLRA
jgi:hypothetical protein